MFTALVVALSAATWLITRSLFDSQGLRGITNPTLLLAAAWSSQLLILVWNPLDWIQLSRNTLVLVGLSVLILQWSVTVGALSPFGSPREPHRGRWAPERPALFFTLATLPLLILHILDLTSRFGISLESFGQIRSSLGEGNRTIGFYFFYPALIAAVLWLAAYLEHRRPRYLILLLAVGSTLVLTTGRTNILFLLFTATFATALFGYRVGQPLTLKHLFVALLIALGIFIALGSAVGKTYANSEVATLYGDRPPIPEWSALPLLYWVTPLSALGIQIASELPPDAFAPRLFSPLGELVGYWEGTGFSEIQEFTSTPWSINLYTMLGPYFATFQPPQALLALGMTGLIIGALIRLAMMRHSPYGDLGSAILLTTLFASPFDHLVGRTYIVLTLLIMFILDSWDRRRLRTKQASLTARSETAPTWPPDSRNYKARAPKKVIRCPWP